MGVSDSRSCLAPSACRYAGALHWVSAAPASLLGAILCAHRPPRRAFIAAMSGSVLLALLASLLMPGVRGRVINICSNGGEARREN
jgi:hypothetical protein